MGRSRRKSKSKERLQKKKAPEKASFGRSFWMGAIGVLVVGIAAGYSLIQWTGSEDSVSQAGGSQARPISKAKYIFREKRATLSPSLFVGKVARAYGVAKEIPEVLDQLYCYCECKENIGHKSLLSCYADRHAST